MWISKTAKLPKSSILINIRCQRIDPGILLTECQNHQTCHSSAFALTRTLSTTSNSAYQQVTQISRCAYHFGTDIKNVPSFSRPHLSPESAFQSYDTRKVGMTLCCGLKLHVVEEISRVLPVYLALQARLTHIFSTLNLSSVSTRSSKSSTWS